MYDVYETQELSSLKQYVLFCEVRYKIKLLLFPASRFSAILIPSSPGALYDLAENEIMAGLLNRFIEQKSKSFRFIFSQ